MATMDAQEITFNQDPEATGTDDLDHDTNARHESACCCLLCCPCRILYWYIAPLTCQLCHTLKCWFFHPINFAVCLFLMIFDATMLSVGIGIIPLCCMGIPLLWISMEFIIAFSRMDLGMNYYMVEDGKKLDESKKHLLTLSLYFTEIPLCCCYNERYDNCMNLMFERMKYLFTNWQIYKYIVFQVLIRPIITCGTWWIHIVVAVNTALVGTPIWYLVDDSQFKKDQVIVGWNKGCKYVDDPNDSNSSILDCDKDYVWIINTFGRALAVGIIALLVLPLTMRMNNWFAYLNKIAAYKFYTWYYTDNVQDIRDKKPILDSKHRFDSV
jgi:hypothetical protein